MKDWRVSTTGMYAANLNLIPDSEYGFQVLSRVISDCVARNKSEHCRFGQPPKSEWNTKINLIYLVKIYLLKNVACGWEKWYKEMEIYSVLVNQKKWHCWNILSRTVSKLSVTLIQTRIAFFTEMKNPKIHKRSCNEEKNPFWYNKN